MTPLACWLRTSISIHRHLFIELTLHSPNIRHLTDINQQLNVNLQIQEWTNLSTVSRYWVLRRYRHSATHFYLKNDVSKKHYTATSGRMIIAWQFTNDFQGTRHGPISDFSGKYEVRKTTKILRDARNTNRSATHITRDSIW
jgi:hypothetical protein